MGWMLLGVFILAGIGYIGFLLLISSLHTSIQDQYTFSTAVITWIPAPTLTPVISPVITDKPEPTVSSTSSSTNVNGIAIGSYVKISGTAGVGLNIRDNPGTDSKALFLGMDSEVFLVKQGPQQADGLTWWYLVAPYDSSRSGWAAANYLVVVQSP